MGSNQNGTIPPFKVYKGLYFGGQCILTLRHKFLFGNWHTIKSNNYIV